MSNITDHFSDKQAKLDKYFKFFFRKQVVCHGRWRSKTRGFSSQKHLRLVYSILSISCQSTDHGLLCFGDFYSDHPSKGRSAFTVKSRKNLRRKPFWDGPVLDFCLHLNITLLSPFFTEKFTLLKHYNVTNISMFSNNNFISL